MKPREINLAKLILDNYRTEEVINYLFEELSKYEGEIDTNYDKDMSLLRALNEKLNGKKSQTVL